MCITHDILVEFMQHLPKGWIFEFMVSHRRPSGHYMRYVHLMNMEDIKKDKWTCRLDGPYITSDEDTKNDFTLLHRADGAVITTALNMSDPNVFKQFRDLCANSESAKQYAGYGY